MKGNRQPPTVNLSESVCLVTLHNKIYAWFGNWHTGNKTTASQAQMLAMILNKVVLLSCLPQKTRAVKCMCATTIFRCILSCFSSFLWFQGFFIMFLSDAHEHLENTT